MVTQTDIPGFGYWLAKGANTLWQDWDGSMSLNHIMFGTVSEWFYESLAGIQLDDKQPGFRHFIIRPDILPQLDWVTGRVESPFGTIYSSWEKVSETITMRVTVPPNATATVYVPYQEGQTVKLNGEESEEGTTEKGCRIFEVASGTYVWGVQ